jgi:4,5-DOPA dioxygenase extradiol
MSLNETLEALHQKFPYTAQRMPALFVGHGSPMNAVEDNEYSHAWAQVGRELPQPTAILCVSAHWETRGTLVTGMERPKTIHDFGGFPPELYAAQYPAPGSPELAQLTVEMVRRVEVCLDQSWGLDHGTWSVLTKMFPDADIPVIQFSLDRTQDPEYHYALGQELRDLRKRGVLIIGSGNIVHNLRAIQFDGAAFDWAVEFDETIKNLILDGNHRDIVHYEQFGSAARLAIPTNEHYLPLLYVLGLQEEAEQLHFFTDTVSHGSLSMRSVWIGD